MKGTTVSVGVAFVIVIIIGSYSLGYASGIKESLSASVTGAAIGASNSSAVLPWLGLIGLLISGIVLALVVLSEPQKIIAPEPPIVEPKVFYMPTTSEEPKIQQRPQQNPRITNTQRINQARSHIDDHFKPTQVQEPRVTHTQSDAARMHDSAYNPEIVNRLRRINSPQPKKPF